MIFASAAASGGVSRVAEGLARGKRRVAAIRKPPPDGAELSLYCAAWR